MLDLLPKYLENRFEVTTVVAGNIAVGTEYLFTVPANKIVIPLVLCYAFTADANVATRSLIVLHRRGGTSLATTSSPSSVTATQSTLVTYAHNAGYNFSGIYGVPQSMALMPLQAGDTFGTLCFGIQVGDQYTGLSFTYLEADITEPT